MLQDVAELVLPWIWEKVSSKGKDGDDETSTTSRETQISIYSDTLLADGMTFGK